MGLSRRGWRLIAITLLALFIVSTASLFVLYPAPPWPYLAANAALGIAISLLSLALPHGNRHTFVTSFVTTFLMVTGLSIVRRAFYPLERGLGAPAFWQGLGLFALGLVGGDLVFSRRRRALSAPGPSEITSSAPPA